MFLNGNLKGEEWCPEAEGLFYSYPSQLNLE